MRLKTSYVGVLLSFATVLGAALGGCGGGSGADCVSLCSAAQKGNCTAVKGDCSKFCAAIGVVEGEASCDSQYNDYESCLGSPSTVCSTMCNSQESTLASCVTPYCGTHSNEASCATLAGSF